MTSSVMSNQVTITGDQYGTFTYEFQHNGQTHECGDLPSQDEALRAAKWHLRCLADGLPYEMREGLGAIYRPLTA